MKKLVLALLLCGCAKASLAAEPICSADALKQAGKLLQWHYGPDSVVTLASQAKPLAPLSNPVNKAQKLNVLEVMGYVQKTNYRMRLIYFYSGGRCLLMGQEILELSSL
ncbi:hypothetical protein [Ottowia thiooxydans]|uniref:Lipoprotein n=1 Tax=Ottowia thiooxydans TaxID=219182 RepID=A0ABV2QCG4_9BURK